jgi:hypothetical protein
MGVVEFVFEVGLMTEEHMRDLREEEVVAVPEGV